MFIVHVRKKKIFIFILPEWVIFHNTDSFSILAGRKGGDDALLACA